jgi:dynein light chain 4
MEAFYKTANYALVQQSDMPSEMREEAVDICTQAIEKYSTDLEKATQVRSLVVNANAQQKGCN